MIEREYASIMRFILDAVDATPYYDEVPQDFMIPAVYFPVPRVTSDAGTLSAYSLTYDWFIHFFALSTPEAYDSALEVLLSIRMRHNLIPVVNPDGSTDKGFVRVRDPDMKKVEDETGVVQLHIVWESIRPYASPPAAKTTRYAFNTYIRSAMKSAQRG